MFRNNTLASNTPNIWDIDPQNLTPETQFLLAELLAQHPKKSFFDSIRTYNVDYNSKQSRVKIPVAHHNHMHAKHKIVVQLRSNIVKYKCKKNPAESRYAVCERHYLTYGLDGEVYKVAGTIKLVKDKDGNDEVIYKPKNTSGKKRLLKRMVAPRSADDTRTPAEKAEREHLIGSALSATSSNPHMKEVITTRKKKQAALLMRYFEGGMLSEHCRKDRHGFTASGTGLFQRYNFSDIKRIELAIQIGEAIVELHNAKVIHRDIKPKNMIYDEVKGTVKIIDFGFSEFTDQPSCSAQGTPKYASPEAYDSVATDEKSDAYSYACLLQRKLFSHIQQTFASGKYSSYTNSQRDRIDEIIMSGLESNHDKRASLPDMIAELRKILAEMQPKVIAAAQTQQPANTTNASDSKEQKSCAFM